MYRHYIAIDERNRVLSGWSTGEHPGFGPTQDEILLTKNGSVAFAINGVEHPQMTTADNVPLYKWDGTSVLPRTQEEIDADKPKPQPEPEPSDLEKLRADVDYIMVMEGLL